MLLKLCKTNAVYEALPEKRAALDVGSFAQKFRSAGYAIMAELPQMMIAKKGCELTIYRSGRILIKTDSRDEAEKAAKIFGVLANSVALAGIEKQGGVT